MSRISARVSFLAEWVLLSATSNMYIDILLEDMRDGLNGCT